MKKITLLTILLSAFCIISCSKEAPTPTNETLDKGHEQWYTLEVVFTQGILKDSYLEKPVNYSETTQYPLAQKYIFRWDGKNVTPDSTKPILLEQGQTYSLEFFYYNKEQQPMNQEFIEHNMNLTHQHFFIAKNIVSTQNGVEKATKENIISYKYRDTEPYNQNYGGAGVKLRPENDPIGLKGFFTVEKAYQEFDLNIILVHVISGNKLKDNGLAREFYNPSTLISSARGTTDLSQNIPVKIFTNRGASYANDLANALKISVSEAEKIIQQRTGLLQNSPKVKF